jgi:hypothetical protein
LENSRLKPLHRLKVLPKVLFSSFDAALSEHVFNWFSPIPLRFDHGLQITFSLIVLKIYLALTAPSVFLEGLERNNLKHEVTLRVHHRNFKRVTVGSLSEVFGAMLGQFYVFLK